MVKFKPSLEEMNDKIEVGKIIDETLSKILKAWMTLPKETKNQAIQKVDNMDFDNKTVYSAMRRLR